MVGIHIEIDLRGIGNGKLVLQLGLEDEAAVEGAQRITVWPQAEAPCPQMLAVSNRDVSGAMSVA